MEDVRIYADTYFRNERTVTNSEDFFREVAGILAGCGFEIEKSKVSRGCPTAKRGAESLYCHPHHLSGYVLAETVEEVRAALEGAKNFTLGRVDQNHKALNYTEEEYAQELAAMKESLAEKILQRFTTKRRNLYLYRYELDKVDSGLPHFRTGVIGATGLEQMERRVIEDLFASMVEDGRIVAAAKGNATIYRTAS